MTITTTQKKGPAAAPTAPDHGSNPTPLKGSDMNTHAHSTPARPSPEAKRGAFLDLEARICDLATATAILADSLDQELWDRREEAPGAHRVLLTEYEYEKLAFLWCDVVARARRLRDEFYSIAHEGKEAGQ